MALILVPDKAEEPVEKALKALRKAWLKEALDDPQFYESKEGAAALETAVKEQLKDLYVGFSLGGSKNVLCICTATVEVEATTYTPFSVLADSLLDDAEESDVQVSALKALQALCAALEQKLKG